MKLITLIFFVFISAFFTQCKSPTDTINDAFKSVNESMEKSNRTNSIKSIYDSIDSNRKKNTTLAKKADSIFQVTEIALHFIDSLKLILYEDTSGIDTKLSATLFINSSTSDILKSKLSNVYECLYSTLSDNSLKPSLDSILNSITDIQNDKKWKEKYFSGRSSIGALTILNSLENDCIGAARICLQTIRLRFID